LQFTLKDYQGDAMEYTVQTSPDIGSKHETGVHDGTFTVAISGMTYGAVYSWYVNVTDGAHWTQQTFRFSTGYPSPFDPFDYGWHYRKQIIIDHTQVAGNLENFPVLLSTIDPDLMKAQSDGDDLLFMNGVGSARKLRHEIETFNQETGTLIAWVNISALSSSHDTEFYLYYGNPSCINQQYPEKVWTSSFVAVWHLNNNPTGQIFDSTKNKNNGNAAGGMTTVDLVNGKIGSCLHFDGFDDLISFSEFTGTLNRGTCVAWVQTTSTQRGIVWSEATKTAIKPYILCGKYYDDDFWFARDLSGGDSNYQGMRPMTMNNGQWHQVAWLSYGSGIGNMFYFDGQPITLLWQDDLNPQGLWFDDQPTNTHSIAALDRSTDGCFWMGLLDEIRIISTPLSDAWISTEFANQNTPSSFVTIGPEET
jgi:biopolymer transport protein ExbB